MKKQILIALTFIFSVSLHAQTIPNSGMENWTANTNGYDSLNSWVSSNLFYKFIDDMAMGLLKHGTSVTKTTGRTGTYAVQVKNVTGINQITSEVEDTLPGVIMATSGTGDEMTEGFPVSSRPASLRGYYKFTQGGSGIDPNIDTAAILVGFTKYNTVTKQRDSIGGGFLMIYNTASSFTSFAVNIMYLSGATPDSAQIIIASSITEKSFPNTTLIIDDLSFSAVSGASIPLSGQDAPVLYPNPAQTEISIRNIPQEAAFIEIKNYTGQTVSFIPAEGGMTHISTSGLAGGLYFYTIKTEDGTPVFSEKFYIAR